MIWTVARQEGKEILRKRWIWLYVLFVIFFMLSLSFADMAFSGYRTLGGFNRTAAGIIQILPLTFFLFGAMIGAIALASDRERGILSFLLAQPLSHGELFWGKAIGVFLSTTTLIGLSFVAVGVSLAHSQLPPSAPILQLLFLALLLNLFSTGMGLLVGCFARTTLTAVVVVLLLWAGFAILADLAIFGSIFAFSLSNANLLFLLLLNPLHAFKVGGLYALHPSLDLLGPVGLYAEHRFGTTLSFLTYSILAIWGIASLVLAAFFFRLRKE